MRLLFCCELYHPSVGGVQEVMRQLAERMVRLGHEVTVATTGLIERTFTEFNGVRIEEFVVSGNAVTGMRGETDRYCEFVLGSHFDAILIKAAQQWTFDALWPVLHKIHARKVLIPCGFSGLYRPAFGVYFQQLPRILRQFDHLIFYATEYRDIEYVRTHGMRHFSVIPNGASEIEFDLPRDQSFRLHHNIPEESFVFLTVGSFTGAKGHLEVTKAFARLNTGGKPTMLILNGNISVPPRVAASSDGVSTTFGVTSCGHLPSDTNCCINRIAHVARKAIDKVLLNINLVKKALSERGWLCIAGLTTNIIALGLNKLPIGVMRNIPIDFSSSLQYWIRKANSQFPLKRVLVVDLPRRELIQAYKNADLFVFASNIEYSPLVLFESAAAGTPFLSVNVGNAEEIAEWTAGGIICKAPINRKGLTKVNPRKLAVEMRRAMDSPEQLAELGRKGHDRWQENFTWAKIVLRYEKILAGQYT